MLDIVQRAWKRLNLDTYAEANPVPVASVGHLNALSLVPPTHRQYILRMMVRGRHGGLLIPPELDWLRAHIEQAFRVHAAYFPAKDFVYVTVRHGLCSTHTDAKWHVDGFSMRKIHYPEQNFIWNDEDFRTEYVDGTFTLPMCFDPLRHNLHQYFEDYIGQRRIGRFPPGWSIIDPYIVHRRPPSTNGMQRTFIRISFVPIEIEDSRCTPNPLLPSGPYPENRFIETLTRF